MPYHYFTVNNHFSVVQASVPAADFCVYYQLVVVDLIVQCLDGDKAMRSYF